MRKPLLVAIAVALLGASAAVARAGDTTLAGVTRKDYRNGYAIRVPVGWSVVPPSTDRPLVAGDWYGPRLGAVLPRLTVLRIPRQTVQKDESGELALPDGMATKLGPDDPFTARDGLDRLLEPYGPQARIEERKDVRVGRDRGVLYRATINDVELVQVQALVVRSDEFEYGVFLIASQAEYDEVHAGAFRSILSDFRLLRVKSEKDVDYDAAYATEGEAAGQEKWLAAVKDLVDRTEGWGWLGTEHYLVLYDEEIKSSQVKRIAVQVEAIRKDVYEKIFPTDEPVTAISIVRVCKDRDQFVAYGGPPRAAGYWNSAARELVFYMQGEDSIRTLYHEAFHQYIHYAFGEIAPAPWFNEGHGDYFAGFDYRGRFVPGRFHWRTQTISDAIRARTTIPLETFLHYTQEQYYANAALCYAQGWALVYFLRHTPDERYRKILPAYFEALRAALRHPGQPAYLSETPDEDRLRLALDKALAVAFEGIDMEKLERDWQAFTR